MITKRNCVEKKLALIGPRIEPATLFRQRIDVGLFNVGLSIPESSAL